MKDEAFDNIYINNYKPVNIYINRIVRDKVLAEDITQESFIKILSGLKDFDEEKKLNPWIYRIAHNTCIDYIRKKHMNFELIDNLAGVNNEYNNPELIVLNEEKRRMITEALIKINPQYRDPLFLRAFGLLSYKEIASSLKLSEQSVKTQIHRARRQFKSIYSKLY